MNKPNIKILLEILALFALAAGLVFLFNLFGSSSPPSQGYPGPSKPGASQLQGTQPTDLPYPYPAATQIMPTVVYEEPPTSSPPMVTFPPPEILTPLPEQRSTPYPLATLAADAAGSITYLAKEENGDVNLYSLAVDKSGKEKDEPKRVKKVALNADIAQVVPSPGGGRFALLTNGGQIYILDSETNEIVTINAIVPFMIDAFINWHPDNLHILVGSFGGIYSVNVENGDSQLIVSTRNSYGLFSEGAFSPDGQQFISEFARGMDDAELWIININGDSHPIIVPGHGFNFSWSPDGQFIFYCGGNGPSVLRPDGSVAQTFESNLGVGCGDWPPVWSPDSKKLLAVDASGFYPSMVGLKEGQLTEAKMYLIDVEQGTIRLLIPQGDSSGLDPTWSPDGRQVVFVKGDGKYNQIWVLNLSDDSLRQLKLKTYQGIRYLQWKQ